MSGKLATVEQAAEELKLHPKTVLRYIRDGRLPATKVGKAYRIDQRTLDAFSGVVRGHSAPAAALRATCIVEIVDISAEGAERMASLLNAAGMTGDSRTAPLHLSTAFDPTSRNLKIVVIASPSDAARLLELVDLQLRALK
ncbi:MULTISPECIES: helix-turn-helix domain-containing protein [unclassified Bosea (in: a-proteobacteria)]|uniref:helix-turn-helix domain-containing protein n=1 Tax=unclassified Bosea (in: a-proteobacteria) TaxID=2653178 RepID=UPI000F74D735|nr:MULTISPECIES: helix-turn-helix domain-containing protein [unclassified Bosea (in: a-proteobacteria)]AZO82141.1 DNA-binding protein [Bosea sp. Tri-49]RXT20709.1 DNA-binding protein [Bosea sp. Tri-39]RXT33742.1 DNA-binding protein [Bosea sp. Tri-54]